MMIHTLSFRRKRANYLTIFHRKICRIDTNLCHIYQSCSPNDKLLSWSPDVLVKLFWCMRIWSIIKRASSPHRPFWLKLPKHSSFCSQRQQPSSGLITLAPPISPWLIIWQMGQSAFGVKLEGWFIYHKFVVKNSNHCYFSSWIPLLRMSALFWKNICAEYFCAENCFLLSLMSLCLLISL